MVCARIEVTTALRAAEAKNGVGPLPVLLISPSGQTALEDAAMSGRRVQFLSSPMVVSRFVRAAQACLGQNSQAVAA